ncbi:uncharacterized protein CIMG_12730 [Coccidioides immitis RS]|uniref:Uncharacterized protein n=1 Tax=Coccidioides immitis (strain RS) TaxID=246410 RepID=A0A0D8JSG5_COCIM|nr:uncharacterized protein CIMG_12730 [Coccidioides immitis RS]KJF60084.1 hypothetical protein CIMG_12730 [Coccidioides immitis RS]
MAAGDRHREFGSRGDCTLMKPHQGHQEHHHKKLGVSLRSSQYLDKFYDILWLIELLHSNNIAFSPSTPFVNATHIHAKRACDVTSIENSTTHESRPLQQGDVHYFRWEIEKEFAAFASVLEENNDEMEDKEFILRIIKMDPRDKPRAKELLEDEWFNGVE